MCIGLQGFSEEVKGSGARARQDSPQRGQV